MGNEIEKLQKIIDESRNIVFFGGAGVSTESGIRIFEARTDCITRNMITAGDDLKPYIFYAKT